MGRLMTHFGCHRIRERCFHFRGEPLPLCARCLGCAVGQTIACTVMLAGCTIPATVSVFLFLAFLADVFLQEVCGVLSTNHRRLTTGIAGGAGLTALYLPVCWFILSKLFGHIIE